MEEWDDILFSDHIMTVPLLLGFKHPIDMEPYDGTLDPEDHLDSFKSKMCLDRVLDLVKCRAFPMNLEKAELKWFNSLPSRLINKLLDLFSHFLSHLIIGKFGPVPTVK